MSAASKPLKRSLDIMDLMTGNPRGCSVKEISDAIGLPMPTAYRLVLSLVDAGYLQGAGRHALYRLGQRYWRQVHACRRRPDLADAVRELLSELAGRMDEAVFMTQLRGRSIQPLGAAFPRNRAKSLIQPGDVYPIHASSSGKLIAAHQNPSLRDEMLVHCDFKRYQSQTITSRKVLEREFEEIRRQGYAECDDELDRGVYAMSCPVETPELGVIYSVGVVCPQARLAELGERNAIHASLRSAAKNLAKEIR
jgi:IclR family transcriptional regulator, acetate operon repressor